MIDKGDKLDLQPADPGEQIDIISFVVTKAGWERLKDRLKISPSNHVRILTRLIHKSASDLIEHAEGNSVWHHLPGNHAKAILYHKQKLAILGSFNVTKPSLGKNIECLQQVDEAGYHQLAEKFEVHWNNSERDECAFGTPATWQAVATLDELNCTEDTETCADTSSALGELTNGPRKPWPFQEDIIQQVMAWLDTKPDADSRRIVKLPTGAGKTLVAAEVIRRLMKKNPHARILWVCHRVELLRQSWLSICRQVNGSIPEDAWFVPQHIKDESGFRDRKEFSDSRGKQIVFCTQGMLGHLLRYNRRARFDLTVVDECHRCHPKSSTYRNLYKYCTQRNIPRLGLTATPLDSEKRRFSDYWDTESMYGTNFEQDFLVREGFLSRINKPLTRPAPTGYKFRTKWQDATPARIENEFVTRIKDFNNHEVNRTVAKEWAEYRTKRQRVLCFAVTIEHAETLKTKYFAKDDCVRMVHSDLQTSEIRETLEWFMDSCAAESRLLISVLMLAEGIDLPKTDCLFMVRPTFSPELYNQMLGRGLRGPKADGTEDCAVVDFTSQFVGPDRRVLQCKQYTTGLESDRTSELDEVAPEEEEEPDDLDASGRILTVKDLKEEVADLQDEKGLTIQDACEELAQELAYKGSTLVNYLYTKPDDYPLGWEDPESDPAEQPDDSHTATGRGPKVNGQRVGTYVASADGSIVSKGYVTSKKLLDLRAYDFRRFEQIAFLTNVASSTLQSYCSNPENFRRWRANNRDKMDQVLLIIAESLERDSDAA